MKPFTKAKPTLVYPVFFVAFAIFLEMVAYICLGMGLLPEYFLIDLFIILGIAIIIWLSHYYWLQAILAFGILFLQIILLFINYTLFRAYGEIFNMEILFIVGDGVGAVEMSFLSITMIILTVVLILFCAFSIAALYVAKIRPALKATKAAVASDNSPQQQKHHRGQLALLKVLIFILAFSTTSAGYLFSMMFVKHNPNTVPVMANASHEQESVIEAPALQDNDKLLHEKLYFREAAFKKFGFYGFYFKSIVNVISPDYTKEEVEAAKEFFNAGAAAEQSDFYGTCRDDNFIVILMESLSPYAIDPILTPTLWGLQNGGIILNEEGKLKTGDTPDIEDISFGSYNMTNYISKSKTNASECGALTGAYPYFSNYSYGWLQARSGDLDGTLGFALPQMMKKYHESNDRECKTAYLENHEIEFYCRDSVFNSAVMGFDDTMDAKQFVGDSMITGWSDWAPDSIVIEHYLNEGRLIPSDGTPFFTAITTMYTHGPYDGSAYGLEPYLDEIAYWEEYERDHPGEGWINPMSLSEYASATDIEYFKNHQAAAMDLDVGIAMIFEKLAQEGVADKTTIMFYADHETYYYNFAKKLKNIKTKVYTDPQIYNIPMFVASTKFAPAPNEVQIDKFVTFFDVYATVLDLAGIPYNENLCLGESIFLPQKHTRVLLSATSGILSENIFTHDGKARDKFVHGIDIESMSAEEKEVLYNDFHNAVNITMFKAMKSKILFECGLFPQLTNPYGVANV